MPKEKLLGLVLAPALFLATAAPTSADGAMVTRGVECGMLGASGNPIATTISQEVTTPAGIDIYTCRATDLTKQVGSVRWNYNDTGYYCGTSAGLTDIWQETVSSGGRAMLVCIRR